MLVREVMVPNPLMVREDTTILEFCSRVLESDQTAAVVLDDDGMLRGIVSVHDVFAKIVPHYVDMEGNLASMIRQGYFEEKFAIFERTTVSRIMVTEVDTLAPGDSVIKAVALQWRGRRKSVPIVEDGKFVGTITRRSILRGVTHGTI